MMTGADTMGMIQSLQNNSDLQHILEDPALMDAVQSDDRKALEANPQIRKLMSNPTIKDITRKVK